MAAVILLPAILLLLPSPFLLYRLQKMNLRFGVVWFASLLILLVASAPVFWLAWQLPQSYAWAGWQGVRGLYGGANWFLVDPISWPLALAVTCAGLAAILGALLRGADLTWKSLGAVLVGAGLGLGATFAGSIPVLLLSWTAMDVFGLALQLSDPALMLKTARIVNGFAVNLGGVVLILLAMSLARVDTFAWDAIPPAATGLLLFAAAVRLGLLPFKPAGSTHTGAALDTTFLLQLSSAAGAIVLTARVASVGTPSGWQAIFIPLLLLAGYSSAFNAHFSDRPVSVSSWTSGIAALAMIGAVQNQPASVIAWGTALIFGIAFLFLASRGLPRLTWFFGLAVLVMSGLPFTPTWPASRWVSQDWFPGGLLAALLAALLWTGFLRSISARSESPEVQVRGVYALYLIGIAVLLMGIFFSGWAGLIWDMPETGSWWFGPTVVGFIAVLLVLHRRGIGVPDRVVQRMGRYLSFAPVDRVFRRMYRTMSRGVNFLSSLLEGQSAVLWALLILALIASLFVQLEAGG